VTIAEQQQQQKKIIQPPTEGGPPNAEHVTSRAIIFLKALGNKHGIRPRKVSLQGQMYVVEMDVGKDKSATVQIEVQTREIKEYEIKNKEKEEGGFNLPLSPKTLIMIFGISAVVYLVFGFLNISGLLLGH
jgi:hypothetical protein